MATFYKSYDDTNIDSNEHARDLGIIKGNIATFSLHIINIVKKLTDKMEWVMSVPVSEALAHADTLKSLVIPSLEYCCQLWNPWKKIDIQATEAIQRMVKITKVQHFNNWGRDAETPSRDAANVI